MTHGLTKIVLAQSLFMEVHQLAKEDYLQLRLIENDTNLSDIAP